MKYFILTLYFLFLFSVNIPFCQDNDVFFRSSKKTEPNILIIIDTSASMGDEYVKGKTKLDIVKASIKNAVNNFAGKARIGLMIFNEKSGAGEDLYEGGKIIAGFKLKEDFNDIPKYKEFLNSKIDSLIPKGSSPIAETLAEAMAYFKNEKSYFNNLDYKNLDDPFDLRCRKNSVILISDGRPQFDNSLVIKGLYSSNDYNLNGNYFYRKNHPALHDIAFLLHDKDLRPDKKGLQNVCVYTIGFRLESFPMAVKLLQDTADRGQGKGNTAFFNDGGIFINATNESELINAFNLSFSEIEKRNSFFTSPVVPVMGENKSYSGENAYISMFLPKEGRWSGNIKKYKLNSSGSLCSKEGSPVLNDKGVIKESTRDCFNTTMFDDGGNTEKGGVGSVLLSRYEFNERRILTNKNCISGRSLKYLNNEIEPELFNLITRKNMAWKLGDFNHSRPCVYDFSDSSRYIFAGSNDGLLHCFEDSKGKEVWAFYPWNYFPRINELKDNIHSFFLDGSPCIGKSKGRVFLLVGERRGGTNYYCLDISNIENPKFRFRFSKTESAQSWKTPQFIKVKKSKSSVQDLFLITGGYDSSYDYLEHVENAKGFHIYGLDPLNGKIKIDFNLSNISENNSKNSIVSACAADSLDDGKDIKNLIFAGDLEGNFYGFRDDDFDFPGNDFDGQWIKKRLFTITGLRSKKLFYEADFVLEKIFYNPSKGKLKEVTGEYIFFGTGDRANPDSLNEKNFFYCIKNDWHNFKLNQDITIDKCKDLKIDERAEKSNETADKKLFVDVTDFTNKGDISPLIKKRLSYLHNRGWFFELKGKGEKCLSSPVVYDGVVYFTTYTPDFLNIENSDPCESPLKMGTTKVYAVNYKTGLPCFNLNIDNDLNGKEVKDEKDRFFEMGKGCFTIPPSPEIVVKPSGVFLLVGMINPIFHLNESLPGIKLHKNNNIEIIYWKID